MTMTFHFTVTFKQSATQSWVLISVKHSLLRVAPSPLHLDRQQLLFRNRLWVRMLLFVTHFIYLPDGRNLCKVSLFISKAADATGKETLHFHPKLIYLSRSPLFRPLPSICL